MKAENENWNKSLNNSEFHYKITVKSSEETTDISIYDSLGRTIPIPNPSAEDRGATYTQIELPTTLKGVIMVKVNNEVVKVVI